MTNLTPQPGFPNAAALLADSAHLAAHLNTLTPMQVCESYANGVTCDAEGRTWRVAPDHWLQPDPSRKRHPSRERFVADSGAAAFYGGPRAGWMPVDPDSSILTDAGLAHWGTEGWGYPVD